jgi:hypothetical protein
MRASLLASIGMLTSVAGCPSPQGNAAILWLAPGDSSETTVKLVESEPGIF